MAEPRSKLVRAIRANQKQNHDTLYCAPAYKRALLTATLGSTGRADNLQISGLQVVEHNDFERPIVCEKGDVFPLAKDFKQGNGEYNEGK